MCKAFNLKHALVFKSPQAMMYLALQLLTRGVRAWLWVWHQETPSYSDCWSISGCSTMWQTAKSFSPSTVPAASILYYILPVIEETFSSLQHDYFCRVQQLSPLLFIWNHIVQHHLVVVKITTLYALKGQLDECYPPQVNCFCACAIVNGGKECLSELFITLLFAAKLHLAHHN